MTWIEAKIPKFNMLIAKRQKPNLDKLFIASSIRGVIVFFIGAILLLMIIDILEVYQLSDRLLEKHFIFLLLLAELAVLVIGMLAKYLRAHKSEPFYILSVVNAVLVITCIFIVIPAYGLEFYFYTIAFIYWLISLPISVVIFHRFVNKFYSTREE
jgi:CDP-diglyceride synthetase